MQWHNLINNIIFASDDGIYLKKYLFQTQTDRLLGEPFQEQGDDVHVPQVETNLKPEPQVEPRPFLIYNKVSAVINESKHIPNTPTKEVQDEALTETPADKEPKTGSIWYEYGCV